MTIPSWDDVVLIEHGRNPGDPTVVTVNCPDKAGLGCDLTRTVLEFGLYVTRGDSSTDGRWCYIVLWVVPRPSSLKVDWESLKTRLLSACPSCLPLFYLNQQSNVSQPPPLYLLKVFSVDRKGLLHDVTKVLSELELLIQRVKVMTTPDGKVLDLFFITDLMDLLLTKKKRDDTCGHLSYEIGEDCISCELELAGPEYESQQGFSSLLKAVSGELFCCDLSDREACSQALGPEMTKVKKATITVDNHLSPAHTLLQIQCADQKGLIYDVLRTAKDCNIQVAYGRFPSSVKGYRTIDLFIQKMDGGKIVDPEYQTTLCSRLKEEMLHPLQVTITSRGPDTELLVTNPVELCGMGRPRVFHDVTFALKMLGICVFSSGILCSIGWSHGANGMHKVPELALGRKKKKKKAEIGRHSTADRQWEIYRFLLDESQEFPLASNRAKREIVDRVRRALMGW